MWSNRQLAECTWFVSLNGYDSVSAWNAYLLNQSLPQDCTAANIGSSTYPFRTWSQVVADTRSVTGQKVAVGLGKWGSDAQRTVWTKSMYWLGMTGTVIDMQLCTLPVFKFLVNAETVCYMSFVNGMYMPIIAQQYITCSITFISCVFDYLSNNAGSDNYATRVLKLYNCVVVNMTSRSSKIDVVWATNTIFLTIMSSLTCATNSIFVNCIMPDLYALCLYCCFTNTNAQLGYANNYNINTDPLFNNAAIGDYTLRSDSPCLFRGKNGAHIGALGEARTINPNSPEMADGTAIYSLTGGLTDLIKTSYIVNGVTMYMLSLRTGLMSGTVETGWIDLGRTREVDSLRFVADMFYTAAGNYAQAPSPDLNKLSVSYKAALTEAEKAGVSWVSTEWGAEDLAVSARYIKLLITVTSTTPAP